MTLLNTQQLERLTEQLQQVGSVIMQLLHIVEPAWRGKVTQFSGKYDGFTQSGLLRLFGGKIRREATLQKDIPSSAEQYISSALDYAFSRVI